MNAVTVLQTLLQNAIVCSSNYTSVEIHPKYYSRGNRGEMLWTQLAYLDKITSKGVYITVNYYKDNNTMYATITICEIEQQKPVSPCVKVDIRWDVQSRVSSPVVP